MGKRKVITVSVRDFVEFVLRRGDLGGERRFVGPARALEGTRGHQRVQRSAPEGYEAEVPLSRTLSGEGFDLVIQGRIDGILRSGSKTILEEIKTVHGAWDGSPRPLHWAQLKCYGAMLASAEGIESVELQLTYLELESEDLIKFREAATAGELEAFFLGVATEYLDWLRVEEAWLKARDASMRGLAFPFSAYRPGQRPLAVAVYRSIGSGSRLFAEAPTGIGKTASVLFPAVKALGEGRCDRIFFLTARTVGRMVAEETAGRMREQGLRCRSVTLTARDKICFNDGQPCEVQDCRYAQGYYDRRRPALRALLHRERIDRENIEAVAREHTVCPFELSLDAAEWSDVVICDYNYAFDPFVSLRRFFGEEKGKWVLLVDEAHNLPDRARDMFSAELNDGDLREVRKAVRTALPVVARALDRALKEFQTLGGADSAEGSVLPEAPKELVQRLRRFLQPAEQWLARNEPAPFREDLLAAWFEVFRFVKTAEAMDHCFVTLVDRSRRNTRIRLYCLDPSTRLREAVGRGQAVVFFSATLSPLPYFQRLLGGGDAFDQVLQLPSPFPPEHLDVLVEDRIGTDYRSRDASVHAVAAVIRQAYAMKPGNYLVFFPSHKYLQNVFEVFQAAHPEVPVRAQANAMDEAARAEFLAAFEADGSDGLVGFAVMGGIFGEGIDLVGERLIGAVVVGVGLPQVCLERECMREHFDREYGAGFEYAYQWPGMNRVLQAAGRVIRSETDRGTIVLIDRRFAQPRYRQLFPPWWQVGRMAGRPA